MFKKWYYFVFVSFFVVMILVPMACIDTNQSLSDNEIALAKSTAATYSICFKAIKTREELNNNSSAMAETTATACPTIDWYDQCHWTVDFGNGCTASDGNYYSGSFSALSCDKLQYSTFCANEYCVDGTIEFTDNYSCSANKCYHQKIELTVTGPEDVIKIDEEAVAGVTGTTYYLYAPAYQYVTSQVYGTYSSSVIKDLILDEQLCPYPTTGTVQIDATGYDTITIDFNTGDCHTAYVNGEEIDLDETNK